MPAETIPTEPPSSRSARARAAQALGDATPADAKDYRQRFEAFFDQYAADRRYWQKPTSTYRQNVAALCGFYIEPGSRVLELGCSNGDLLASLKPSYGVGIDISGGMVRMAAAKHPHLTFHHMAAEDIELPREAFDYIVLSDLVGYLYDIRLVFERLRALCHARTRIVVNWYSRLWQPLLSLAERAGLKYPQPVLNWTTVDDISNILQLTGFEVVHHRAHMLVPVHLPLIGRLANRYLAHVPGFRWLCLTNWIVARPLDVDTTKTAPVVSVICPCRNESGNIASIAARLPALGGATELIFVEGHSTDDTLAECERVARAMPETRIRVFQQTGKGKGDAVRLGFSEAKGDVLMILDADISVAPEDLRQFYDVLVSGKAEFVNGSRLVYAMDPHAMQFLNMLGNKFFAVLLTALVGQPIKDSLCGTKVLFRRDYDRIAANRAYFGDIDPFGDFDLLFGAAKLNLRIVDLPVRYHQRTYGTTNISRFSHGWLLMRMSAKAAGRLLFVC